MKKNTLIQTIEDSTRPLYNNGIIDLNLTNTNKQESSGVFDLNLSDHLSTFIIIKKEKNSFQKSTFRCRSHTNFSEDEFTRLLTDRNLHTVCDNPDAKAVWAFIKHNIEEVLDIMAPIRDFSFGNTKPGWLSNDLMEMMKDRNKALKSS